ncbi:Ig-like domain-containing protein [Haloferula rosea]|uniref:Tandem-95 repeat protein n=1 Tax=Haloferula rosea TaxID=490093 RepID=A0A934VGR5_9BACT|nr:putative Ig domain-containing protein [Haloferula rosea]MBK1828331.1 tandem-95 repeat protein [Haloferula rosea]
MSRVLQRFSAGLFAIALTSVLTAEDFPLGPLGGTGDGIGGSGLIVIKSLQSGEAGEAAGLQVGDFIAGADGFPFGVHSTNSNDGYQGAVQELGMAIDRAEGSDGVVDLQIIRSGVGGLSVPVTVGTAGSLGPAWPVGSSKSDAIFEESCDGIHSKVQASSSANFGYNSGWFGMILLAHPDWNSTTGPNAYRLSIDKLRVRCENYLNGRSYEPVEPSINQALYDTQSPGLENWDVCASSMFLSLYRSKTGDTTADAIVQTGAEMIGNRIQHWSQYNDAGTVFVAGDGRMGHGGVHGDYSHYNGAGGLNIMNAHAATALALAKLAGADMTVVPGTTLNDASGNPLPDLEEKFLWCWSRMKVATRTDGGADDGNVGYVSVQGGGDSSGRTGGAFAGWNLYGLAGDADDVDKAQRQEDYLVRRWYRQQHCHAYTLGGVALSQMAMPWVADRGQQHYQENSRFFAVLSREPDGSISYFPGRQNNGGDGYLNKGNVALVNAAIATAVRSGNLPGFPAPDADRLHIHIKNPVNSWPTLDAREAKLDALSKELEVEVTDVDGNVLAPAAYTASWTPVSGPGVASFSAPSSATSMVTVPQDGTYRVQLEVSTVDYTLTEPIDLVVDTSAGTGGVAPYVVSDPISVSASQGDVVNFTVTAQGSEPLLYQWRLNGVPVGEVSTSSTLSIPNVAAASAGDYDCVITNGAGFVTSGVASLSVEGVGSFAWGALWRDVFTGLSGSSVSDLTSATNFPTFPDAGGPVENGEAPEGYGDNYGQRISGWITPPESGNYRFYLASDDNSELWLSTDATRANRALIVSLNGYRGFRQWSSSPTSALIPLVGGERYYVEVLHKESGGGDNCSFTWDWQSPGVWTAPTNLDVPLPGAILEYQVGGTTSDTATPPADYVPMADDQSLIVYGTDPVAVTLTGSDFEPGSLSFSVISGPSKGSLTGTAPNLTYTADPGASGTDIIEFEVSDGSNVSSPGTVTLTLIPETGSNLKVWEGLTDSAWAEAGNWLAGVVPGSGDAVIFDNQSVANLATNTGAGLGVERLIVTDPIGAVGIAGGTLTLADGIEMLGAVEDVSITAPVTLGAAQAWAIGSGGSLTVSGDLAGSSALTKSGPGLLVLNGTSPFGGTIEVTGGTLELSGGGWAQGYVGGASDITIREGATVVNVNAHSFGNTNGANRSLVIDGGTFLLAKETYVRDVEMTEGWIDNSVGGSGDIRSRSGGSVVTVRAADESSVIASDYSSVGSTTFVVEDGAASSDLTLSGALTNSGFVRKDGDGRMTMGGISSHTGGIEVMTGRLAVTGSLAVGDAVLVEGGSTLEGTGSVNGVVTQQGGLEAGVDGVAVFSIGTLDQDPTAVTTVELGGVTPGSGYDQIQVSGSADLGGTLNVLLIGGFEPLVGDVFDVVVAAGRTGSFATYNLPPLPAGRSWEVTEDPLGSPGVRLSVMGGNQAPAFSSNPIAGSDATQGISYSATLDGSAVDPDAGDTLTFGKVAGPAWLTVAGDGSLSGVPGNADVGLNVFTVEVFDALNARDEATLNITVVNVNDPPVFTSDPIVGGDATQGVVYGGTLGGSAVDPDAGDTLTFGKVSGPAWLTVAGDGSLSGVPGNADVGLNVFTVEVLDALNARDEATLNITVMNVNDPPAFTSDPIVGSDATQDVSYSGTLVGSVVDPDSGDTFTYQKISGPAWLAVASNGSLSGSPLNAHVGSNAFVVQVTDAAGATDQAALTIDVINVNDPPAFGGGTISAPDAVQDEAYMGSIAGSASDPDVGEVLTYSKLSGPAWLSVAGDGGLSGVPGNDDVGLNTFSIRVADDEGLDDTVSLEIDVTNVNEPPVFTADPITGTDATEDAAYSGSLAAWADDPDAGDELTFSKVSGPAWLMVAGDGSLSGTPENEAVGLNEFVVAVSDEVGESAQAALNITVVNTNDPPEFSVDPVLIGGAEEDEPFLGETLAGRATDPDDGDILTYSKVSGPGWLSVASDGELTGTPPAGSAGTEIFVVRVTDVDGLTDEASLEVDVAEPGLSLPWESSELGSPLMTGSATDSGGVFSVSGSGRIIGRNDRFQYAWQTLEGDGTITARVHTLDDTGPNARVGIMVRDTLGTNSRHVFLGVDGSGNFRWLRRTSPGAMTATSRSGDSSGGDAWLRLQRVGGMITASKSLNGTDWITLGSLSANLPSTCYFGLAVASGHDNQLNESKFDSVSVTP